MRSFLKTLLKMGPRWWVLLSALLIALAVPPWDLSFLIWVALIPWFFGLNQLRNYRQALLQGFWLSFWVGIGTAPWLALAVHDFYSTAWAYGILALILYAATVAQPQFLLFAPLFCWLKRRLPESSGTAYELLFVLTAAFFFTGLDWIVPKLFSAGLGDALYDYSKLRQLADLGGVGLLTFLVVLTNLVLWRSLEIVLRPPLKGRALLGYGIVLVCLLAGGYFYGFYRLHKLSQAIQNPERILRVGLIQGNVAKDIRLAWAQGDDKAAESQLRPYLLQSEKINQQERDLHLLVWPETVFPGFFGKPVSKYQMGRDKKVKGVVTRLQVPLLFGSFDVKGAGRGTQYNSLFSVAPNYKKPDQTGYIQSYHKNRLMPLGEYLPLLSERRWFRNQFPQARYLGRGQGARVLAVDLPTKEVLQVEPIICSEALDSQYVIDGANNGADLIVNIGNDGWYGPYGEPEFHLGISQLRSVETRLPQVRAANSGISALILPNGEIAQKSEWGKEQTLFLEVPIIYPQKNLVMRWGNWFGPFTLGLGALFMFVIVLGSRRRVNP